MVLKRLKLKEKPKRLKLSAISEPISVQSDQKSEIEILLDQYHLHTNENKKLPFHEWISYKDHLPLNNNDHVLIYNPKWEQIFESKSYIQLQHALYDKYTAIRDVSDNYWMRIKLPEK